jgi:carbonic anhydrase
LWLVLKEPVSASPRQIARFARPYPMNARPLQPAAGCSIEHSN